MKLLIVVPARGGSKRLPGKNKKLLGGMPLITWTLNFAKKLPNIIQVIVSTDDLDLAEISKESGLILPWLRPPSLSTDSASSIDVVLHALDWYESKYGVVDGVMMLQPTSPFRSLELAMNGIQAYGQDPECTVVGVTEAQENPCWMLEYKHDGYVQPLLGLDKFSLRSQLLPKYFIVDGTFYLASPKNLRANKSFISAKTVPLVAKNPKESIDIDCESDWTIAEAYLKQLYKTEIH